MLFYLVSTLFDLPIRYSIGVNIVLLFLFVLTSIRLLSQEERTMFLQMGSTDSAIARNPGSSGINDNGGGGREWIDLPVGRSQNK